MNWTVIKDPIDLAIFDSERNIIADVYTDDFDARLIAAAPELLSALEAIVEQLPSVAQEFFEPTLDMFGTKALVLETAKAAIAKAKGELA